MSRQDLTYIFPDLMCAILLPEVEGCATTLGHRGFTRLPLGPWGLVWPKGLGHPPLSKEKNLMCATSKIFYRVKGLEISYINYFNNDSALAL